jgi:gas vesicle protein
MSERSSAGDVILSFLVGGALGLAAGLLLAPQSGKATRKKVGDWLDDVEDKTEEIMEKGKAFFNEQTAKFKDGHGKRASEQ